MPPKISVSNFYFGFGWIYLNWDIMKPTDQLVVKVFCCRKVEGVPARRGVSGAQDGDAFVIMPVVSDFSQSAADQ